MIRACALVALVAACLSVAAVSHAQTPGKVDLEAAEVAAELIGAPVLSADGVDIGEVVDVMFDDEGRPARLRMNAAAHLGLGTRRIEIPRGAFIVLRGAVVLELPAEAVQALPELAESRDEK
jgi:PRC-barrel domain